MGNFWITNESYHNLLKQAREKNYITSPNYNIGLSRYLNALADSGTDFIDSRPQDIKAITIDELESGRFPTWRLYYNSYPRCIRLTKTSLLFYASVARQYGIVNKGLSDSSLTGSVLEAIGTNWLVPSMPLPTKQTRKKKPQKMEFEF